MIRLCSRDRRSEEARAGGIDCGKPTGHRLRGMYRFPEMEEIERPHAIMPLDFPTCPIVELREIPVLLAALRKVRDMPDLCFAMRRDMPTHANGLASPWALVLDCPSIGCAKSLLIGHTRPCHKRRELDPSHRRKGGGNELARGAHSLGRRPISVSQGHASALKPPSGSTLPVTDGYRDSTAPRAMPDHLAAK